MTYKEIYEALEETDLPVVFNFWDIGHVPALPYIVFTYPNNNDFSADNTVYKEIVELNVELCTKRKDIVTEKAVEAILAPYFGNWEKSSIYLEDDDMQVTTYSMEVLIDG